MSAVLIISILLLTAAAFAFHFRQARKPSDVYPPYHFEPARFGGLFSDPDAAGEGECPTGAKPGEQNAERRDALLARAAQGDKQALAEAQTGGDAALYHEVLDALAASTADEDLFALALYIGRSDRLRANSELAARVIAAWGQAPSRRTLAGMLHCAALGDDADVFQRAVETALEAWHAGRVPRLSAEELRALVETGYWMLASEARRSGAGFVLKRRLVHVRRELAAAARPASS